MSDTTHPDAPAARPRTPADGTRSTAAPVTAVVVARGTTPFLATTLRGLAAQTRPPTRVLLVDVGERADTSLAAALRDAGLPDAAVVRAAQARTFGDAVCTAASGQRGGPGHHGQSDRPAGWLWLLHDDSAPDPTALAELVSAVEAAPSVTLAGVKQRTWTRPARLLEVGVRTSRSGRRMTDIEPGEVDQGQHDGREDVLGVGLVGALVRRDVWDALGGTDPALGPFGDGLDLSRRARLAGHRVVVVPGAVVRHAQASYHGLRGRDAARDAFVDLDADGQPDGTDPNRSFAARRTAVVHQRVVWAPLPLVPLVAVLAVFAGLARALVQIAAKEPALAAAEIAAPLRALGRPGAIIRGRALARRTRRVPRRTLRPLQADLRTVWQQWRDRRLTRAEARRVVHAPSELELRELAALALRRRIGLAVVAVVLLAVTAVAFGRLIVPVLGGASLVGGALVTAASGLGDLWSAATSGWVAGELGAAGPADALLTALLPGTALAGGSLAVALTVLLLGSVLLAGLGAWCAAGAATRSVGVRCWAAIVWAALPSLLLAAGQGRVGAVLVHVALPWVVLGIARAVGVQQADVVLSGLVTAARTEDGEGHPAGELSAEEWPDPEAWARAGEGPPGGRRGPAGDSGVVIDADGDTRNRTDTDGEGAARTDADASDGTEATTTPGRGTWAVAPDQRTNTVTARIPDAEFREHAGPDAERTTDPTATGLVALPASTRPSGSIAAAAGAALAFALVAAGAPVLLLPGLLVLIVVAAASPRGRRLRVLLAGVPAVVLLGPMLAEAASRGGEGVRMLLADPGPALASVPESPLAQLLGVPVDASALAPSWSWLPDPVTTWWPAATGAAVLLVALLGLWRGAPQARAVRLGWFAAAVGLAVAIVAGRVVVGQDEGVLVVGWAGSGVSFAMAGLLAAGVTGTRDIRATFDRVSFGWRQVTAVLVTLVVVVLPLAGWGSWAWQARRGASDLTTMDHAVVPAIGRQTQDSADAPRVLALALGADDAVRWQLMRGDGPQMVDEAAAVRTRELDGSLTDPSVVDPDEATTELEAIVGTLSVGSSTDVAAELAALAVANVLVPELTDDDAGDIALAQARTALVGRLDATPGLERITEGDSGVIWRVQPTASAADADADTQPDTAPSVVASWARLVPDATAIDDTAGLTGAVAVAVPAVPGVIGTIDTRIGSGSAHRLLVLAERADAGWYATLDGRTLRVVPDGWRQTFEVGADGGHLVVQHGVVDRTAWTVAQGVVGLLALLLALPVRRRRADRR